mgnify:CR=1 FL=1
MSFRWGTIFLISYSLFILAKKEFNIDLDKAIEWIDIAFKDSDDLPYWQLRYKALINEKAGKINKAKDLNIKIIDEKKFFDLIQREV